MPQYPYLGNHGNPSVYLSSGLKAFTRCYLDSYVVVLATLARAAQIWGVSPTNHTAYRRDPHWYIIYPYCKYGCNGRGALIIRT